MSSMPSSPGEFYYPPSGSNLQFNSVDSVVASWSTFDPNPTDCDLQIYYWPNTNPWKLGYNQSATANGTATLPLDIADGSSYIGQLNFFYTDSEGGREKYLGPLFDVAASSQAETAHTWSLPVARASSTSLASSVPSTSSADLQTSILTSLIISDIPPTTVTVSNQVPTMSSSSSSSTPSSPSPVPGSLSTSRLHLGSGPIAGIVVGAVCVGLAAALIFYRRRKSVRARAQLQASSIPAYPRVQGPVRFIGEKDGFPSGGNELPGDILFAEMPSNGH